MKNAPRKPMVSAIIAVLVLISPIYAESASNLEKYLDCSSEKKIDIAFVFDTTNSMGGEISELRATANKFATDLEASNIDYHLGLVEFRDFPETCDGFSCGSPGDYAYSVKGNGTLTSEISTFGSWIKELKAGGGGSPGPEAVLAALRHAGSDLSWRSDAEKAIIVLTDAGIHPDGSCCNAEGDTLEGTIFELVDIGARAYVIGPEDASLEKIAENTGGQFYEIRSGLSLKPLLEAITKSLGCSFRTDVATECENNKLEVSVQLIGKETIPYISGQTEAWVYLDQAGSISRFNLSYDREGEAYLASVPDVCGPVELTVYGRAGDRSAVQTVQVECDACGVASEAYEQGELSISGRIYDDSNGDGVKGADEAGLEGWEVTLLKPDGGSVAQQSDRNGYYIFSGLSPGSYEVVANAQENWTATAPETGMKDVELVDVHESEIDIGFKSRQIGKPSSVIVTKFNKTFGGPYDDAFDSIQLAPDGGYIISGYTNQQWPQSEAWILKVDAIGDLLWNKTFVKGETEFYSVQVTNDDGFVLVGTSTDWDNQSWGESIGLVKTDSEGNEVWNKTFPADGNSEESSRLTSIQLTPDNGFILAGWSTPRWQKSIHWLFKIDPEGNKIWTKTFDDEPFTNLLVLPTPDDGYILAGDIVGPEDTAFGGVTLIKIGSEGNEVWKRTLLGLRSHLNSIQLAPDDGYILAGYLESFWQEDREAWLLKVDAEGNELLNKTFGAGPYSISEFTSAQITSNGDCILAGSLSTSNDDSWEVYSNRDNLSNAWLLKVDSEGNEIWNKTFGGSNYDSASSVQLTPDGGYIVAGATQSFGVGMADAWLFKVDSEGNIV